MYIVKFIQLITDQFLWFMQSPLHVGLHQTLCTFIFLNYGLSDSSLATAFSPFWWQNARVWHPNLAIDYRPTTISLPFISLLAPPPPPPVFLLPYFNSFPPPPFPCLSLFPSSSPTSFQMTFPTPSSSPFLILLAPPPLFHLPSPPII